MVVEGKKSAGYWWSSNGLGWRVVWAKRWLNEPLPAPATWGMAASNTIRPDSSTCSPWKSMCWMTRPDCEIPKMIAFSGSGRGVPSAPGRARGLGVPASSRVANRKNEIASRMAARPSPTTRGSLAV